MGQRLLITLLTLVSTVSFAQQYRPVVPRYNNDAYVARPVYQAQEDRYDDESDVNSVDHDDDRGYAGENDQAGKFNGDNQASNTQNSPQINIYNANSNANKQKSAATGGYANADSHADSASYANTGSGNIAVARKNLENKNNDYVVDQLEYSRLEDERYRAQRLFNNNGSYATASAGYQTEAYVAKPYAAAVAHVDDAYDVKDNYVVADNYDKGYSFWQQAYISPLLGITNTNADNIDSGLATGVAMGSRFATNFSVEGSFLYSDVSLDGNAYEVIDDNVYPSFEEVQQFSLGAGVSYHFYHWGIFQPKISGLLAYTYRDFDGSRYGNASASSTAVDAGIGIGADMTISKNVTVGAELRWMNNLSYSRDMGDTNYNNSNYGGCGNRGYGSSGYNRGGYCGGSTGGTALEEASYQMLLINAKFNF
jgi:hypothetical protein